MLLLLVALQGFFVFIAMFYEKLIIFIFFCVMFENKYSRNIQRNSYNANCSECKCTGDTED